MSDNYAIVSMKFVLNYRLLLEESPLNCIWPCTTVSHDFTRFEFTLSRTNPNVSYLYIGIEKTDIEIHEVSVTATSFYDNSTKKPDLFLVENISTSSA
jgi:hypothetical protein